MDNRILVLIVDDDVDACDATSELLESKGYMVACAYSASTALALLRETAGHPCILLCDVMLPDMDGRELAMRVRWDPMLAGTEVVLVTGSPIGLPPDAPILHKPVHLQSLLSMIERACGRLHTHAEHQPGMQG